MEGELPKELDVYRWMSVFDMNQDGKISFEEFVATMIVKMDNFMTSDDIIDLFEKVDRLSLGYITIKSIMEATELLHKSVTEEEALLMVAAIDTNCDRKIDFPEFNRMMKVMRKDILFCVGAILAT